FRADLYYRLNVMPIRLPPLRERLADLEALTEVLMEDIARRSGLPARSLAPDALEALAGQAWPGNVRELRNTLEQAALMSDDHVLHAAQFALGPVAAPAARAPVLVPELIPPAPAPAPAPALRSLAEQVADTERSAITSALQHCAGNRVAAAKLLGMPRSVLYDRLSRYPEIMSP
ncbi:MAG: helix-turn-helix domain-containing protein, partial [Rubrivivax sp.]|nr:helix-turn-helix domain-containing protein [Rubrivivax sp.]